MCGLSGLNLYKRDKEIIESSVEWLTDSIVGASQQLLATPFVV